MNTKTTCRTCKKFTAGTGSHGDCAEWEKFIKLGKTPQYNALFYRDQLGGDCMYSNLEFLADEPRDCKQFVGRYAFIVGD